MMRNRKFIEEAFFNRLLGILKTEKQTWWAEKTCTSQSMVSNYWYKRKHPRGDKIARILELKGISANWLYFDIGPKNIAFLDESEVERKQNVDRQTQVEIVALVEENIRLKEKIAEYEVALKKQKLTVGEDSPDGHRSASHLTDAFSMARTLMDVIIKMADVYAEENIDNQKLSTILDWVIRNQEAKKRETTAMLQDLDKLIK